MIDRSLQEETIFAQALELDSALERAEFLDRACGGDWTLRAEVEALLRADAHSGDLLDLPEIAARRAHLEHAGTVIGPYTLKRNLGEGGMGTVWLAEQARPVRRQVALKILKPGMDSRQVIARFEAERQALALMDHPHIARVLDAGATSGGRPYFVMEVAEGVPITSYCEEHGLTFRKRLELFLSVCQAVQHAHQKGIVHRDLKPSNVLVVVRDDVAVPKVIDFGVAKATGPKLTEQTMVTMCGQLVGTLDYMSPEQASFNTHDIDTRSDIYALGVLLYELLTGSTPFEKKRLRESAFDDVLRIIREEEPPRPSVRLAEQNGSSRAAACTLSGEAGEPAPGTKPERELGQGVIVARVGASSAHLGRWIKGDLDWIVMKCLEKDRSRRYETANCLALDLKRFLADEPVVACPPTMGYRLHKFVKRNRRPVVAALLVLLALVAGIIGTTWGLIRATDARALAVRESNRRAAALVAARQSASEARDKLWLSLYERARAGRLSRQTGQRLDSLAALTEAASIRPDERLRDEAIAAMALPDVRCVRSLPSAPADALAVAYSPQYRLYARADRPGFISVCSIPDDHEIARLACGHTLGKGLFFSPDARHLLAIEEGFHMRVWRLADGKPILGGELADCRAQAFSPDGQQVAIGQGDYVLFFDLATGRSLSSWRVPARVHGLAYNPSGTQLAVGYFNSSMVSLYDTTSGALVTNLSTGPMAEAFVFWDSDGERLAVTGSDPRIQVFHVPLRRKLTTLEGHTQYVSAVTFHPHLGLVASHSWDGVLRLWDAASGRPLLQLPLNVGDHPRFSSDGRWLGATLHTDQTDLLEVIPSQEYRTLTSTVMTGRSGHACGDISPDGRLLVVGRDDGARVWDLQSGKEIATMPPGTPYVSFEPRVADAEASEGSGSPQWCLLTSGPSGLLRWPATSLDPEGKRLRLGPPKRLSTMRRAFFSHDPDGGTRVAATEEGGPSQIVDLEAGKVQKELDAHPQGDVKALSGDGNWAASCGWHSDRVRLWNARTGERAHEWVLGKQTLVFFTPDSRALVISRGGEFSFWDVVTRQPIRKLRRDVAQYPGWVAFSPDAKLMALEMAPGVVHLKDAATCRTVAKLEDPHGDRATWQGFTPDGTQLVVVSTYSNTVHVWNLRAIRARLAQMGLDWDWPEFPRDSAGEVTLASASEASESAARGPSVAATGRTEAIEIIPGDSNAPAPSPKQTVQQAIERLRRQLEANPESPSACNNLAWALANAPEPFRDPAEALALAEKASRLGLSNATVRNTLGVAYYRAGRHREAVDTLLPNLEAQPDWALAYDLYFLAMAYHGLGEKTRARDYYDWAVRWVQSQRSLDKARLEELGAFRAEAETLMGIDRNRD